MRIVIIGGGEIGFALAQGLSARHEVFVVDHKPEIADRFQPLDVEFVLGSGTSRDVLTRAGAERADVVVACTGLDEVNIVGCGIARQIASPQTFCFVSREDFLQSGTRGRGLAGFGIDRVIWPEALLAEQIERIVLEPGALDAESFADGAIALVEYRLEAGSPFLGQVADLHLPGKSLIVAVRRGDDVFIPRGANTLEPRDKVLVMGAPDALQEVRHRLGFAGSDRQRVTIVGGGDVGLQLAERLERHAEGLAIALIERDPARGEMVAGRLRHTLVLNGDGTDLELLETEDVGRSDVLVGVIDNDEKNLLASLLGRQLGVRRIISRVSRRPNLRLFERVGIDIAISARGAAVASVLHQIQGGSTRLLAVVEEGAGHILELDVPAGFATRAIRDLAPPLDSIIGAVVRPAGAFVPRGQDKIHAGDRLIIFTTLAAAEQVRDYFTTVTR